MALSPSTQPRPARCSAISSSPTPYTVSAVTQEKGASAAMARPIICTAKRSLVAKATPGGTWAAANRPGASVQALGRYKARSVNAWPSRSDPPEGQAAKRHQGSRKASASRWLRPRTAYWRQGPGSPAASARIQPVLHRSVPSRPSRNSPADCATRSWVNKGRIRPLTSRNDDAHSSSVAFIEAPYIP